MLGARGLRPKCHRLRTLPAPMQAAGMSMPLHLAASLLAFSAAVGLAIIVLVPPAARPSGEQNRRVRDVVATVGAVLLAAGHALAGAFVPVPYATITGLRATGVVLAAVGLFLRRPAAPAAAQPVLLGAGLAAWAVAEAVAPAAVPAAAWLSVAGSLAVGAWIWRRSARSLREKVATASVALLLLVVVAVAVALSGVGSRALVNEELRRLETVGAAMAREVQHDWPTEAASAAGVLRNQGEGVLALDGKDSGAPQRLHSSFFRGQDFFVVVDRRGALRSGYAANAALGPGFLPAVRQVAPVDELLGGRGRVGALAVVDGRVVAVGGAPLQRPDARPDARPIGAILSGRVADRRWATVQARDRGVGVVVTVGDRLSVASAGQEPTAQGVAGAVRTPGRAALQVSGATLYAGAADLRGPGQADPIGLVVAVSDAGGLAGLERGQARRLFVVSVLAALLAGCASALVASRLVAPIRRLTAVAAAVGAGDLTTPVPAAGDDEVGVLGRTFGEMTASLAAQASQLREAAAVQARLRARLEALTASMSDGLVATDQDGRVVTCNPAAERLLGRPLDTILGRPLDDVLVGTGPGGLAAGETLGADAGDQPVAAVLLLKRPDGRVVPTAATAAPVRDGSEGAASGRVLVLRDVTREAEMERMKGEFLANVSHELRTPLTPIKGFAEILARRAPDADAARRYAERILDSAERLERVIATIVDFAAIDSGRLTAGRQEVAVAALVAKGLGRWRARHPEREFDSHVPDGLPPILGDGVLLGRCLDELVDNAVKFSPGGQAVTVSAAAAGEDPPLVRLSVHDRGVGVEPHAATEIFDDFYQAEGGETRQFGGLGLGLALVRRVVDQLGGQVEVESREGGGSTFTLRLPAAAAATRAPVPT